MAMVQTGPKVDMNEYLILSTETKETTGVPLGSKLLEIDTGDVYYFYNGAWKKVGESL